MIPVDQVRVGYGRGQCTEASIASILEVHLDEVPSIWAGPSVPIDAPASAHQPMRLRCRLWSWLRRRHGLVEVGMCLSAVRPMDLAWRISRTHMREIGFDVDEPWGRWHLAHGPNSDGVSHQVVCDRGELAHDPNPRRRGIVATRGVHWLVPVGLIPPKWAHWPSFSFTIELEGP